MIQILAITALLVLTIRGIVWCVLTLVLRRVQEATPHRSSAERLPWSALFRMWRTHPTAPQPHATATSLSSTSTQSATATHRFRLQVYWYHLVIIFMVASVLGLILEELWTVFTMHVLQYRVGTIWGPFSPLYGFGACFMTMMAVYLINRQTSSWSIFVSSAAIGGALEQLTGWGMETFFHAQSWTYAHLPDHITPYIAWRFLIMWGLLGLVWARAITPWLLTRLGVLHRRRQVLFVALLAVYLALDIALTVVVFARTAAREEHRAPRNVVEQWVDTHYPPERVSRRFQNLTIGEVVTPSDT